MGLFLLLMLMMVLGVIVLALSSGQPGSSGAPAPDFEDHEPVPRLTMTLSTSGGTAIEGTPSTSAQCWVPPGTEAKVDGKGIGDGMVYVGRNLPSVSQWGGVEPALIDPTLPRADRQPDITGEGMGYWPSYSTIPPSSRSGYLEWLAGGRSDPDAYIGYVFLYFYGLERRLFHDARRVPAAKGEVPSIEAEVRRLLAIYGEQGSFRGYATTLLEFLACTAEGWQPAEEPPLQDSPRRWLGIEFQVGVGHMALHKTPLPARWALAWAKQDPEIRLRTPALRCEEEFEELFRIRYREKYGEGFRIKPCKRTVSATYHPASASFGETFSSQTGYPDVTKLVGPRRKIEAIVDACCAALDPFSRWLGRNPEGRGTLLSTGLLPPELMVTRAPRAFHELGDELRRRVTDSAATVLPARAVFRHWFSDGKDKLTKKETVEAAHLFGHAGFGFEPDVRFSGPRISSGDKVVLFKLSRIDHNAPSADYSAAAILLHLASLVAAADGQVSREEKEHLRDHLSEGLKLNELERTRLGAHLEWLLAQPPRTPGGKKRLESLAPEQKRSMGELLIAVAWADGRVEPEEVKILTRVFRLLGLDPASVHQWLHEHQTSSDPGPVSVTAASRESKGFALPPRSDAASSDGDSRVQLDMTAIAAKLQESERVAATLASIFVDSEESPPEKGPVESESSPIEGLDGPHYRLLDQMAERDSWPRAEYDDLADSLGLLPDGALDILNEAAFEICDEPLIEGGDPLEVNTEVAQEMMP